MKDRAILKNRLYLYLTEFFAGMSVMAVELGASRLLAPYFCMGFTMLSVLTPDGPVNVNECDYVVISDDGTISTE